MSLFKKKNQSGKTTFKTVKIGNQEWMAENLNISNYRNGDPIPHVEESWDWEKLETGAWHYPSNNSEIGKTYGKLYNWHAVNDPRGLAPEGWHIPTDDEWTILTEYLGGEKVAGGKLKEAGNNHWNDPNEGATNESGFTALPGGCRGDNGATDCVDLYGCWWSSTESRSGNAWFRRMDYCFSNLDRYDYDKRYGLSVRCIKD